MKTLEWFVEPVEGGVVVSLTGLRGPQQMEFWGVSVKQFNMAKNRYDNGELIQDAFPFLTADEREFLLTGLTSTQWEEHFGESDE